ncbi:MAG: YitT family protein [Lachnoclostridium sp.]|nr:YitT family protein [Lachnoclostridium sp.]
MLKISYKTLFLNVRDYLMIVLGTMMYAFGFSAFILPEKVVVGGVTGIGSIIYFLTGVPYAIGAAQFGINFILLILAWRLVGHDFVFRTIFGVICITFFLSIFPPLFTESFMPDQPILNIVIGSIIGGIGMGFIFTHNGSTGGTDIIAAMVSKHTNVTIGRTMLYVDFVIISSSYLIFHQLQSVVYGFMVLFLMTYIIDMIINTNRQAVQFTIFSKHWERIATAINNHAHRGCTVLSGMGWYTKHDVKILLVVCRKIESVTIFRIIKAIDPDAFITQGNVNGVYGQGFDQIKLKMNEDLSRQLVSEEADEQSGALKC